MKHLFTLKSLLLTLVMLCGLNAWGETATLTFTEACKGSGTDDKENTWTVTSDAEESNFDSTKGVHYGTSKKAVSYLQLTTTTINGTITSIKVNASGASGTSAKLNVTVGGSAFGSESSITKTATEYEFTGNATGDIVVKLSQPSAKIALYVKSITVTYDVPVAGEVAVPTIEATPTPVQDGKYYLNTNVTATIKSATVGATIQYAITGNDVTEATEIASWTNGSEVSFTSSEPATKVLWAKAVKEGNESPVASKEFTFIKEPVFLQYELVVDESQIVPGAKYVITNSDDTRAMLGWVSDDNNCKEFEINISNSVLELPSDFTGILTLGKDETGYTLKQLDGLFLTATGTQTSKTNYMKAVSTLEDNSHWTITIGDDHVASIVNAKNSNAGIMQYNSSSKLFSCYNKASQNSLHLYRMATVATKTGLDAVLVGTVNGMYQIKAPLRVNYKDEEYVYASTTEGGFTKTAPTDAQKEEWWSDKEKEFNQNDWVAIQNSGLEVGDEIEAGSVATLVSNDAFPVVEFVTMNSKYVTAIAANTYRVANFVDSDNELVKKLWLVDPQPAEHCYVKGYVASLKDIIEVDGVFVAEIKSGEKDVVTMLVNYNPTDFSITATGWYRFEGVVVNGTSGLELNAVNVNEGTATGVEGVETSSVKVYGAEGVINVESEEVAPIAVYSANGAIVSSVEASSVSIAVAPGFYIVKAGNSVSKVTVK